MKAHRKEIIIFNCILVVVAAGFALNYYIKYKKPNVAESSVVKIYHNYTYAQLLDSLKVSGCFTNWNSFRRAADSRDLKNVFKSGRYEIKPGMSNQYIIRMIANGWETPVNMVFRGYVRKMDKLALAFSKWFEADSASFAEVLNDSQLIDSLGFSKETFIGMFIPNTYQIYWTIEPKDLILRFKKEYDRFWNEERLRKASEMKFKPMEVITLASIVAEETNTPSEWPKIAGVYINRLRGKIALQACPTIKYAVMDTEPDLRRILNKHLQVNSPYNTYKKRGLPPGPITIPPTGVIDAVLNYEKTSYLYFCAKAELDGTHNFSTNYTQHKKYSNAYNAAIKKREKERAQAAAQ